MQLFITRGDNTNLRVREERSAGFSEGFVVVAAGKTVKGKN